MANILVIEDIPDNFNLVNKVLTSRNHNVLWAQDAESGLDMAIEHIPDMILLDLGLPDYDGQTLAGWLRRTPAVADIPIIVLTAWPEETARKMVDAYGCDAYLSKPVSIAKLIELVNSFL